MVTAKGPTCLNWSACLKKAKTGRILEEHRGLTIYKELCPWDEKLKGFMAKHRLKGVRVPYARNSSSEFYLVNFAHGRTWEEMNEYARVLMIRMGHITPLYTQGSHQTSSRPDTTIKKSQSQKEGSNWKNQTTALDGRTWSKDIGCWALKTGTAV